MMSRVIPIFLALCAIVFLTSSNVSGQLLRADVMNLGVYNPETKHYEKKTKLIGQDDHDKKPHHQHHLGGDGHDQVIHGEPILGGDDHDRKPHHQRLLGGDGHDHVMHGQPILGGDDHDKKPHHQHLLGGDDHDHVMHGRPILGGDDHDRKPHHQRLLGGDGHDHVMHGQPILGGDDHDRKPHHQRLLGGDGHDHVMHGRPFLGGDDHDKKPHHQRLLGGDDHDHVMHGRPILGGDDHDRKPHRQHLLGGDDHDRQVHSHPSLGRDGHDQKPHGPWLGGDDHDRIPHRVHLLGGDGHDLHPRGQNLLGRDGHDRKNPTMKLSALSSFREFMIHHNKQYDGQSEFRTRFSIFRQNLQRIKQFQRAERGTATYGITQFADLTETEFRTLLGFRPELRHPSPNRHLVTVVPEGDLPESFDWREHNAVTPVKNQGMCGSCWAFSTTGNVEGQWAIKKSQLISLSEQELVDCDSEDHGCEGGLPENAYDAIEKLGGLETEDEYPYNGSDGTCHMEAAKARVQVNGSVELPQDEDQLAHWLYKNGPISIGINANPLQFYTGGVSHPLRFLCSPKDLDHGMLIVGFGTHKYPVFNVTLPFWVIKNSWSKKWGEQGYYRVYRGDGTCGLNLMATSSIVPAN